ncbi:MAG: dephospho-CoA kinase, partial [Candidatus Melainabacteria bacterium]|nr:dephospho-CoA kinase [Candidatus Melainabacteria bacterium]
MNANDKHLSNAGKGGLRSTDCTGPYRIGITSSIGAGKSTMGKMLAQLGVPVIDTDHVTHELLNSPNPAYDRVLACFGNDLVDAPGGPINRQKLAAIVFAPDKPDARKQLEAILHPEIRRVTRERLKSSNSPVVAALVPLLFESNLVGEYHETWCLVIDPALQVERLVADATRKGMDEAQARARIAAQMPQEKKAELADRVIDNSGTLDELRLQVEECLKQAREANRLRHAQCAGRKDDGCGCADEGDEPTPTPQPTPTPAPTPQPDPEPDTDTDTDTDTGSNPPTKEGCESGMSDEARDAEYRRILETFGKIGTEEALSRMGNVGTTAHKEAEAKLSMTVNTGGKADDGSECPPREHELTVDVKMTVRQKPGRGLPDEHGCTCHCGADCKRSCACKKDCG